MDKLNWLYKTKGRQISKGDLSDVVRRCSVCQWFEFPRNRLEFREVCDAKVPSQAISMDLIGPLPAGRMGARYIVCIIDHLSRWGEAWVVKNCEASIVLRCLMEWAGRWGKPDYLLTDSVAYFHSKEVMGWTK